MKYRISIVVPIYNVEPYILECLESVANQKNANGIECILVDDCGKDKSMEIAEQFVCSYNGPIHFSVIHHEQNMGLSEARNSGIKVAQGEYIFFLDSDDTIVPDCMELLWSYIQKYGKVDIVQGSFYNTPSRIYTKSPLNMHPYCNEKAIIKRFYLQYLTIVILAQGRLINVDFLKRNHLFFKPGIIHEDNHWTFFMAKYANTMAFCNVGTYYHRYNPNSITGNVNVNNENKAYKCLIDVFCHSIDSFLPGIQKEFILSNLKTVLDEKYYFSLEERDQLIKEVTNTFSFIEKVLFNIYIRISNRTMKFFVLRLLIKCLKYD